MKKSVFFLSLFCAISALSFAANDSQTYTTWEDQATESDKAIVQKIRNALMDDKSLSPEAQSIKIFSSNGKITLRGTVPSELERKRIENLSETVTGVHSIDNRIEVKS